MSFNGLKHDHSFSSTQVLPWSNLTIEVSKSIVKHERETSYSTFFILLQDPIVTIPRLFGQEEYDRFFFATALPTMRKAFYWEQDVLKLKQWHPQTVWTTNLGYKWVQHKSSPHPQDKCHLWLLLDFFQERLHNRFLVMGSHGFYWSNPAMTPTAKRLLLSFISVMQDRFLSELSEL